MKANLMGWIFELCQNPKLFSGNPSGQKIINIIPDRIICHWTLYNIISMSFAASAFCNEIPRKNPLYTLLS